MRRSDLPKHLLDRMHSQSVALQGPPGSGKTYLCEAVARLAVESEQRYIVYLGVLCASGQSLLRKGCDFVSRRYFRNLGGVAKEEKSAAEWPTDLAILQQSMSLWSNLQSRAASRLIVLIDDYDEVRERLNRGDFTALCGLRSSGSMIALTSRRSLPEIPPAEGETDFLRAFITEDWMRLHLPTDEEAAEIAIECWQKEVLAQSSDLPNLNSDLAAQAARVAGRHPGILSTLIRLAAQQHLKKGHSSKHSAYQIERWLEAAQQELVLKRYLQDLLAASLKRAQETILRFIAISKASNTSLATMFSRWVGLTDLKVKREISLPAALSALQNKQLIRRDGDEPRILSSALRQHLLAERETRLLAAKVGVELKLDRTAFLGRLKISVILWLLGLAAFAVFTLLQLSDESLWRNVRYFSWVPWVLYLLASVIARARKAGLGDSAHDNL